MDWMFRACALLALLPASASPQSRRLNALFPPEGSGRVVSFVLGPGGRTVYVADQEVQGLLEIYNAPSDAGAQPIRLAAPGMPVTAGILMSVSPDGQWLVYQTDAFGGLPERHSELFRVPLDGSGSALKLSGPLVTGGEVRSFAAGATHVVYRSDELVDERYELFSAPLDGSSARVSLSGTLVADGDVEAWALSPDGTRVAFQADASLDGTYELFTVPVDGSAPPQRLHPALSPAQDVAIMGPLFSPDSSRVLFVSNLTSPGANLFSVPSDGSAPPLRLTPALLGGRAVMGFAISPLSERVVYRADQAADEVFELFGVPLDGSSAAWKLNGPLVSGGDVTSFQFSPDGLTVAYSADELADGRLDLFCVPVDASSARVHVNGPLQPGWSVTTFHFSADGARVVYYANEQVGDGPELHSAPIDSSGASILLAAPDADETLTGLTIAGGLVLFRRIAVSCSGPSCVSTSDLFGVPIAGGTPATVLTASAQGEEVETPEIDPVSGRAVFRYLRLLDLSTPTSSYELYSVPPDGSAPAARVHPDLTLGRSERDVSAGRFTPDGRWVVYTADQEVDGRFELFRASADGRGAPLKLNGPVTGTGIFQEFALSPDSTWLVYKPVASDQPLFSVRLDGSTLPIPLSPPGSIDSSVLVSPDSARVVYLLDGIVYSVAIDGSAGPEPIVASLVTGGGLANSVLPLEGISPDSTRLVFVADIDTDDVFELFSVPLDGSSGPIRLSGGFVSGGDVQFSGGQQFRFSADGARVVYVADANVNDVAELFSVPLDGSAPPARLNGPLVPGGDVVVSAFSGYRISPDSTRVVYRADQLADDRFALFSVPLDGSAAPIRLNATLPAGGDVEPDGLSDPCFLISPDSTRIVYRADQSVNDRYELFSVPLDGSAPPAQISGPLIPTGDVGLGRFEITSDGARVVYTADAQVEDRAELFATSIDGSTAPIPLGISSEFALCPDGSGLVYLTSGAPELGIVQLQHVALDGTGTSNLSHLRGEGDVSAFALGPGSDRAIYIANRVGDVFELWLSTFSSPRASSRKL